MATAMMVKMTRFNTAPHWRNWPACHQERNLPTAALIQLHILARGSVQLLRVNRCCSISLPSTQRKAVLLK